MANCISHILYITIAISFLSLTIQAGDCEPSGSLTCNGESFQTFLCSPPTSSPTMAKLTNNNFENGGDGGGASSCTDHFHPNSDPIVALSTGWFSNGTTCGSKILITGSTGRSVVAIVVDECDSRRGCDKEHAGLPPCRNNIVDASIAVWENLGLNINDDVVDIIWSSF